MKFNGHGGVNWQIAVLLLFILVILLLGLVFCQPPARPLLPTPPTPTRTVTATRVPTRTPVGRPPTRTPKPEDLELTFAEPKDLLFWRGVLWAVSRRGTLGIIDPKEMYVPYSRSTDGKEAWGLAVAEHGGKSKIAVTHGTGAVTVIDPDQLRVIGQIDVHGQLGRPAAFGRRLFVPIYGQGRVALLDLFDPEKPGGRVVKTIPTEAGPFAAAVNGVTNEILVTHRDTPQVAVLDGLTGNLKRLVAVLDPEQPAQSLYSLAVAPDGWVYVAYAHRGTADQPDRLAIFPPDLSQSTNHPLCDLGEGGQMVVDSRPGGLLYVACHGENTVRGILKDGTGGRYAVYEVGNGPFGLALDENGNHLFVGLKGEHKVKKVW